MSATSTNTKKVPMRTCIGTGIKKPKKEMVRLVRFPDGRVEVDPSGKARGRGANLDSTIEAFDAAVKKGAIERALKLEEKLKPEQIVDLRQNFFEAIEEKNFRTGNKPVTIRVSRQQV